MHHALFSVECRRAHFWWHCDCCRAQGGDVRNARVVAGYVILLPKVTLTGKSWHRSLTPFLIVFNISWGLREIIAEGDTEGL